MIYIRPDTIPLFRRNGEVCGFALVDKADYPALSTNTWRMAKSGNIQYALRYSRESGRFLHIRMHRVILGEISPGLEVDHINGNGLDNRRENLRICNRTQNCANQMGRSSRVGGLKGATFYPDHVKNRWLAQIGHKGKRYNLGYFATEMEAHEAYCAKAIEFFGEFANGGNGQLAQRKAQ